MGKMSKWTYPSLSWSGLLLLWRDTMTTATLIEESIYLELPCTWELWSIIMVDGNGSMQADMVLRRSWEFHILISRGHKQLCVTHLCSFSNKVLKAHFHTDTHLQQGHTYSNKATPSTSATPCGCQFLSNHHNDQSICLEEFWGIGRMFLELVIQQNHKNRPTQVT